MLVHEVSVVRSSPVFSNYSFICLMVNVLAKYQRVSGLTTTASVDVIIKNKNIPI